MSSEEQIERELKEYLEQEPNLRRDQRLAYLKAIFNKQFEINKLEHLVNHYDLYTIISTAKTEFVGLNLPMKITRKPIDSTELKHVAMMESFVSYLNRNNLLKKLVKFDYTE